MATIEETVTSDPIHVGQRLGGVWGDTVDRVVEGVGFYFMRRRYGTTTYTWAHAWTGSEWQDCGDPWPAVTFPAVELAKIAQRVRSGDTAIGGGLKLEG